MSFLGKSGNAKNRVYLSVTPGVGLELIQLDLNAGAVANYSVRELAYNESSREIVDYEAFKNAVADMYNELGINPKTDVVINLPLVSFGIIQLGLLLPNDAITGAIQGEIEQTYIFRRSEPLISWLDIPSAGSSTPGKETRQVLYSAFQAEVAQKISTALAELGSNLVGIENSLSSTFRALDYMGATKDQMQPNTTWNLLTINATGYTIISMSGKGVIEYYDEPLPIKSLEGDEIYDAILQSAQIALGNYPANYLFVVSNTNMVSADVLVSQLNVMGKIDCIENNSFKKQDSLIPVNLNVLPSYASKISLEAIGCALCDVSDFPLKFNYLASGKLGGGEPTCTIALGEKEFEVTQSGALKIVLLFAAVVLGITGALAFLVVPKIAEGAQQNASSIQEKVTAIDEELKQYDGSKVQDNFVFDLKTEVETGVKGNRSKLMNYMAAGESIPSNVWLTYFMTQGNGLVDVKGGASDVNSIYVFFKNMRDSLIGTKLKLQKLEMESTSVDAAVAGASSNYTFEITNMTDGQLNSMLNPPKPKLDESGNPILDENGNPIMEEPAPAENADGSNPPDNQLLDSQPIQQ